MRKSFPALCIFSACIFFSVTDLLADQAGVPVYQVGDNQAVKNWLLSDPIPIGPQLPEKASFTTDFLRPIGGEKDSEPTETTQIRLDNQLLKFHLYNSEEDIIDLAKIYNRPDHLVYAFCYLESPKEQDVYLHMGSDDGYTVFLNHREVVKHQAPRGLRKNSDVVAVHLQEGLNPLLVKNHNGNGGWGFVVEVLDFSMHLNTIFNSGLEIAYSQSGRMGRQLGLSLRSGDIYLGKHPELFMPVVWRAFDPKGELLTEINGDFFNETALRLPAREGIYELEAELPTLELETKTLRSALIITENIARFVSDRVRLAEEKIERETDKKYAGWMAYSKYRLKKAIETRGIDGHETAEELVSLLHAMEDADGNVLEAKNGAFEWAYYSQVDGTGQPFRISVPAEYNPERAYPLVLVMHGAGGRHMPENAPAREVYHGEMIRVNVMGRARFGMYTKLSEVDVLECLAYIRKHWNIDPLKIHLEGGSMGGGGVFKLASRFPHLFATGILSAGFGTDIHVENLVNIPLYSLHSIDDPTVSITSSRTPLDALAGLGGKVVQYETNGLQHAIWRDEAAFKTARDWRHGRQRPEKISHISFVADDELSSRAYWANVLEWGNRPTPASIDIRVEPANDLHIKLNNINILALNLEKAPVNRQQDLRVYDGSGLIGRLPAPLPAVAYVVQDGNGFRLSAEGPEAPAERRHFPGGASNLFHGEPLLIAWGTLGDNQMDETLHNAALMAGRSANPNWIGEEIGEPLYSMLFAQLRVKSDVDVTAEDMQKYNLLLIGTPETNAVIRQLADRLPVTFSNGSLRLQDGASYPFSGRAMGLLYYNPLAPQRYIYLASSDDPAFYRSRTHLMNLQASWPSFFDFALMSSQGNTLITGRHFQPGWSWEEGYHSSQLLPERLCQPMAFNELKAQALKNALGSHYIVLDRPDTQGPVFSKGESRWKDAIGIQSPEKAVTITLSGKELMEEWDKIDALNSSRFYYYPLPDRSAIQPGDQYRISFPTGRTLWYYHQISQKDIDNIRLEPVTTGEAIDRYSENYK